MNGSTKVLEEYIQEAKKLDNVVLVYEKDSKDDNNEEIKK